MDLIAPLRHRFNPSIHQNPLPLNAKPTKISPSQSVAYGATYAPLEARTSTPLPASGSSRLTSGLCYLVELNEVKSLDLVKAVHGSLIKMSRNWSSDSIAKSLISSYLKSGDFRSAAEVFFVGFARNYVFWSSFLEELESFGGNANQVLEVFGELHSKGMLFDSRVPTMVLKMCTCLAELWLGLEIHAGLIKKGFDSDMHLRCALMNFYGRIWGVDSANQVFDEMVDKEDLLWNEAIVLNLRNGRCDKARELFMEMQFSSASANGSTIAKMLQACGKVGALEDGKQIHGYVLKFGMESDLLICNSLINMYSRNGRLELAKRVFDLMEDHNLSSWNSMISSYATQRYLDYAWDIFNAMESSDTNPDIVTWNCLLSGHALHGSWNEVLMILQRMQTTGFRPNAISVTSVLQAVNELEGLFNFGKEIHGYVIRNGLDFDAYVGTSLIDMYVKNDCLTSAQAVFDNMNNRNIVTWNSLISGYSFKGLFQDAKILLNRMEEEGIKPDLVTWNVLISGYSVCGHSDEALALIRPMKDSGMTPDVVSWTALISGSSQNGNYRESLAFFIQMQQEGIKPNSATISSLLRTCGGLSLLQKGKEIHCHCIRNGFTQDRYVATAVIDMYCKSGNLKTAHKVFRTIHNKTLASWNCMIMGYAIYGLGKEVILLFDEMLGSGILPDAISFTALLSGCKNSGLVREGWKYFDCMSTVYKVVPTIEHYSCMVDLLGRAGYLDEAWDFILTMPFSPDATIWGALLAASRIHKNIEYAEIAAKKLFELEPHNSANYVLMMNLYSMYGRWEDVERLKNLMIEKGVKNSPIWSWIQIDQMVHLFSSEENHPGEWEIYFELDQLVSEMKKLGYRPDVNCVFQDIDEAEKEKVLFSHTEKLAVTYGLITLKGNAPIRVVNNTRICPDCHTAAKYVSLMRNREIILRDGARFHHFREGKCSCNDCW
ncbi:hypothetical protein SLA2020_512330 [Shorea laevis]